jgi:hypothetical protein
MYKDRQEIAARQACRQQQRKAGRQILAVREAGRQRKARQGKKNQAGRQAKRGKQQKLEGWLKQAGKSR